MAPAGSKNKRLDQLLVDRRLATGSAHASRLIRAGLVLVDDRVIDKPGTTIAATASLRLKEQPRYVSRGGEKLAGALRHFDLDPAGWVCLDVGASSGGFTDCLLQNGARLVYAVDVAYGQLDWKIRTDPRVRVLERRNIRSMAPGELVDPPDLAVIDVSFVSLTAIIPAVLRLVDEQCRILALVKPQFELPSAKIDRGGIVSREEYRLEAVARIDRMALAAGLVGHGSVASVLRGTKGNQEYFTYLTRG